MSPPNVFFLAIDSLRADAVFGDHISTRNFDAHASGGAAFRQCVATTTTTTPSFSSMLTGCYPPKHGVRGLQGYQLSKNVTTWGQAFGEAGYNTHAEVTGPLLPETGILRGFQEARHRPAYRVPFFGWRDEVVERMRAYKDPWFMMLHIWEVHRPYRSPPDFTKRKDKAGYEAAVHATDEWLAPVFEAAGDNTIVVITGDHGEDYPDTHLQFQMVRAARRLRRGFKLSGWFPFLDNKLAGLEIGHGFALHEHLVRVPLIISGPGVAPGVIEEQVRHIDLFPTIADLCAVDIPPGIDGRSLRAAMDGGSLAGGTGVYGGRGSQAGRRSHRGREDLGLEVAKTPVREVGPVQAGRRHAPRRETQPLSPLPGGRTQARERDRRGELLRGRRRIRG